MSLASPFIDWKPICCHIVSKEVADKVGISVLTFVCMSLSSGPSCAVACDELASLPKSPPCAVFKKLNAILSLGISAERDLLLSICGRWLRTSDILRRVVNECRGRGVGLHQKGGECFSRILKVNYQWNDQRITGDKIWAARTSLSCLPLPGTFDVACPLRIRRFSRLLMPSYLSAC